MIYRNGPHRDKAPAASHDSGISGRVSAVRSCLHVESEQKKPRSSHLKTTIQIATVDGPEEIEAEVIGGLFAVHRDLTPAAEFWTLTHMPTGMAGISGVESEFAAIELGNRLLALGDEFWRVPKNCHFGESAPPEVRRIIRRWQTDLQMGLE